VRLHSRIYLHSLGVLLVVGVATSLVFAFAGRGGLAREMGERMARHVAGLVGERLDDGPALAARVRRLHEDLDVDVVVRDARGRVLAAAGQGLPPPAPEALAAARRGEVVTRARPVPYALAPVRAGGGTGPRATVELSAPRRFGPPTLLGPLLGVGLVLFAVALATRPLARRLVRPLEQLTAAARRLGAGDLGARAGAPEPGFHRHRWRRAGADELGTLMRAFDEMAQRVEGLVHGQRELLANVSHELRSPLARVRVALALLARDAENEPRLRALERDLAELERLVDDALTAARLDASGLPVSLGAVDVRTLLGELVDRAGHDPVLAGCDVRLADGPELTLAADGGLLRRAVWNLVENAAKYGAPPMVLAAARDGDQLALTVTDEGPGIPPEARTRVLEPFVRLDAARTPGAGGVGLGLTLARRVAEVHGGTIAIGPARVQDGAERGCRVTLRLPAGQPLTAPAVRPET
jgi:signal transduction histidine kinase